MDKVFLSIFVGFGGFLIGNGYSTMNFIPPLLSITLGGLILLVSVWIAYRMLMRDIWKETYVYLKGSFDEIIWELKTAKPDVIFQLPGFLEQHEKAKTSIMLDLNRKNAKRFNKIWEQYRNNTKEYYSRISGLNSPTTENWPKNFMKEIKDMLKKIGG